MAVKIKIENNTYFEQDVVLSGQSLLLELKFNTSDEAWYLTVSDPSSNPIMAGLKIMPNQNITGRYPYLEGLPSGNIWCLRVQQSKEPLGRDNLGFDKIYELVWLTSEEEATLAYL